MSDVSGYERKDAPARSVVLTLAGLFLIVAICFGVVALLLHVIAPENKPAPSSLAAENSRSGWRLEVNPVDDQKRHDADIQAKLDGYAWVDRQTGRAHIPIERAMQMLASQGWPDGTEARP